MPNFYKCSVKRHRYAEEHSENSKLEIRSTKQISIVRNKNTQKMKQTSKFKWGVAALLAVCVVFVSSLFGHTEHGVAAAGAGAVIDPEEIKNVLTEIQKANQTLVADYKTAVGELKALKDTQEALKKQFDEANEQLNKLRKAGLAAPAVKLSHHAVSVDCAKYLASIVLLQADKYDMLKLDAKAKDGLLAECRSVLGMEQKTALTSSDIPLPVNYASQIVELVWKYGQARQFCTVYPLGTATTKLPRLKTSPAFGFIAASASVGEKSPQVEFVTFSPGKAGGIVRIPSEIDADSIVPLGQFLARYIARESAKWEDNCLFNGLGNSTYNNIQGLGYFAANNNSASQLLTLTSTKTKITDITLSDLRALRAKVDAAALNTSAYYAHPSMEAFFVSFNTSATVTPYVRNADGSATFDGFPIKWVGVMMTYDTSAHTGGGYYPVHFGDLSYWYLGERASLSVETSRDAYFATDEIGVRALWRFDIENMATLSTASLTLASS
jgi:HK97 family phage major capsid protein